MDNGGDHETETTISQEATRQIIIRWVASDAIVLHTEDRLFSYHLRYAPTCGRMEWGIDAGEEGEERIGWQDLDTALVDLVSALRNHVSIPAPVDSRTLESLKHAGEFDGIVIRDERENMR